MLDKPVKDFQDDEKKIIGQLISSIADKENLVFNAGAGAGKTYALIECLKYICREKRDILEYHNQKAICITYTNTAVDVIADIPWADADFLTQLRLSYTFVFLDANEYFSLILG